MRWLRSILLGDVDAKVGRLSLLVERQAAELAGTEYHPPANDTSTDEDPVGRLEQAVLVQRKALDVQRRTPASAPSAPTPQPASTEPPLDTAAAAKRAIKLRDRIQPLIERAGDDAKTLGWIDQELVSLLSDLDVSVVADAGEVDPHRHEVVDVHATANPAEIDHIAATVRVGYRNDSGLLRPQQVVAYVGGEGVS